MYGDTWQVRWKEFLSDSYVYGSKIDSHMVFYDEFPGE